VLSERTFFSFLQCSSFGFIDIQIILLVAGDQNPPDKTAVLQNVLITLPLTIAILVFGGLGAMRNSIWMMCVFIVGTVAAVAYSIYKLVDIYTNPNPYKYDGVKKSLTIFICITVLLGIITWVVSIMNVMQFRKGKLKDLVEANRKSLMEARQGKWSLED